jgi:hypothetical protein
MSVKIVPSNICTAFNEHDVIWTKVIDAQGFYKIVSPIIGALDFSECRVPGQALIQVPEAVPFVSSGVGLRSADPGHYTLREHRGVVSAYLKREFASPAKSCALVVYTKDAYFRDPDIESWEATRIFSEDPTHVLVAVLAATTESPLSPYRFVWNLAGGNREALTWTADEIRAKARVIMDFDNLWSPVADVEFVGRNMNPSR